MINQQCKAQIFDTKCKQNRQCKNYALPGNNFCKIHSKINQPVIFQGNNSNSICDSKNQLDLSKENKELEEINNDLKECENALEKSSLLKKQEDLLNALQSFETLQRSKKRLQISQPINFDEEINKRKYFLKLYQNLESLNYNEKINERIQIENEIASLEAQKQIYINQQSEETKAKILKEEEEKRLKQEKEEQDAKEKKELQDIKNQENQKALQEQINQAAAEADRIKKEEAAKKIEARRKEEERHNLIIFLGKNKNNYNVVFKDKMSSRKSIDDEYIRLKKIVGENKDLEAVRRAALKHLDFLKDEQTRILALERQRKAQEDQIALERQRKAQEDQIALERQRKAQEDQIALERQRKAQEDQIALERQRKAQEDQIAKEKKYDESIVDLDQLKWADFEIYPGAAKKIHNYLLKMITKCNGSDCAKDKEGVSINPFFISRVDKLKELARGGNGIVELLKKGEFSFVIKKVINNTKDDLVLEFQLGTCINNLRPYLNHFTFTYGIIRNSTGNLSLIMENVNNVGIFEDLIYENRSTVDSVLFYSLIFQVMMALQIAQDKFQFIHGDLHTGNVLLETIDCCNVSKNEIVLYNYFYNNQEFEIPVQYNCKIIDLGRSRVNQTCLENNNYLNLTVKRPFTLVERKKNNVTYFEKNYDLIYAHNVEEMIRNRDIINYRHRSINREPNFKIDMMVFLTFIYRNFQHATYNNSGLKRDFYSIFMELVYLRNPFEVAMYIYKYRIQGKLTRQSNDKIFYWNYENKRSAEQKEEKKQEEKEKTFKTCESITKKGTKCLLLATQKVEKSIKSCQNDIDSVSLEPVQEIKDIVYINQNNFTWCYSRQSILDILKTENSFINFPGPLVKMNVRKSLVELNKIPLQKEFEVEETTVKDLYQLVYREFECNQYCSIHFKSWVSDFVEEIVKILNNTNSKGFISLQSSNVNYIFEVVNEQFYLTEKKKEQKNQRTSRPLSKNEFIEFLKNKKLRRVSYGSKFYNFV